MHQCKKCSQLLPQNGMHYINHLKKYRQMFAYKNDVKYLKQCLNIRDIVNTNHFLLLILFCKNLCNVPHDYPHYLYGNPLQLILHEEFLTIASQACTIKQGQPILAEFILDFDVLGMALNRAGSLLKASMIADFCWKLLDCGFAVIEGG